MKILKCTYISGRGQDATVRFHSTAKAGRGETEIIIEVTGDDILTLAAALKHSPNSAGHAAWHLHHGDQPFPCQNCK